MIQNKSELKIGKTIINKMQHFKQELKILKIDNKYVFCELNKQNTVMPIDFYLHKHNFSIKEGVSK